MRSFKFVLLWNPAKRWQVPKGLQETHPHAATGGVTPANVRELLVAPPRWARRDLNPGPRDYESPALTAELQAL